jgi:hypothetical protein
MEVTNMNCDCDTKEDRYGSEFREAMKTSMKLPWMKKPFYATNAKDTTPHRTGIDRRSTGILKRLRRIWWHWSDSLGLFLWLVAALLVSVMAWMCFVGAESWFR